MIITSTTQFGTLLNLVHDYWFDVERIALDEKYKTVTIHLEAKKENLTKGSRGGIDLVIKNAEALTIDDTEKVRDYDLNEIAFDAANGSVTITGGVPITINIKVTALNVEAKTVPERKRVAS